MTNVVIYWDFFASRWQSLTLEADTDSVDNRLETVVARLWEHPSQQIRRFSSTLGLGWRCLLNGVTPATTLPIDWFPQYWAQNVAIAILTEKKLVSPDFSVKLPDFWTKIFSTIRAKPFALQ